MFEAVWIDQ